MSHNLPAALRPPNQRVSNELRGNCCTLGSLHASHDDVSGEIRSCSYCARTYINDHGLWRNTLSFDKRKLQKLHARKAVDEILRSRS